MKLFIGTKVIKAIQVLVIAQIILEFITLLSNSIYNLRNIEINRMIILKNKEDEFISIRIVKKYTRRRLLSINKKVEQIHINMEISTTEYIRR